VIRGLAGASAIGWTALYVASRASRGAIRTPGHASAPADAPLISVVVPARDEERDIEQTLRLLSGQHYPSLEIVVVDDCSRDGTRAAIARAAADDPRIVLVDGSEPPPGWLGKPWACAQAVDRAHGEWLCFTDADVRFAPDALASALAFALAHGQGGATLSPRLVCGSFWERTVQPVAALAILALVAPPLLSQRPDVPVALAAGAFMLVRRDLYERAGGHSAVRDRVADDLQLARAIKRAGGPLVLAHGEELLAVRMYHGHRELWRGWRKNAAYGLPGGVPVALAGAVAAAIGALAPPIALVAGPRRRGALGLAALLALRASDRRTAPTPLAYVATAPLGLAWIAAVTLVATLDRLRGGSRWRGRRYAFAR
jgi:cellulose synthase/poly-beta-1,6-N-acetylglucosamine synthase-like glycosyltransferase